MNSTTMRATGPMHLLGAFYAAMAGLALYGQSDGLMMWLAVNRYVALAIALAVELLAAVLFAFADWRRTHHGEQAIAARLLSVSVALGVAAMNFYGHEGNIGTCALFTGASLAGYAVWVLHTEARRRDALRAAGRLPAQPPTYGLALWLRMPRTVWRARQLATATPGLGVHDSIAAAETEKATSLRHKAIAAALRRKLTKSLDPISADIAMVSYDLDQVAARLAESVDYARLTALLAADIDPDRLGPVTETTAPLADKSTPAPRPKPSTRTSDKPTRTTADLVAALAARHPELSAKQVASRLGIADRTARRYMPRTTDIDWTPDHTDTAAEQRELAAV